MKNASLSIPCLFLIFSLCWHCQAQEPVAKVDFDDGRKLGAMFTVSGKVGASGTEAPVDDSDSGAQGRAAHITTQGDFSFYTRDGIVKFDTKTGDTIRFQIHNPEGLKQRFDFIAIEKDKKALFWRKVEFDHKGWKNFELPMEWFRWNQGRVPTWENIRSIGIRGGRGLDFWIDGIEIADLSPDQGPSLSIDSLAKAIFPKSKTIRTRSQEGVWVITDHEELDIDTLHRHLKKVKDRILMWFPQWKQKENTRPPVLVVAKDLKGYQTLFGPLGAKFVATVSPPVSGGYHLQGIGFSFYDPKWGTIRPVFTHEFTHSVLSSIGKIGFEGTGWFQEGVANYSQSQFHDQRGLDRLIRLSIEDPKAHDEFEKLTTGNRIAKKRYWQVMTLVDFLVNDPEMAAKLPDLLSRFDATGKTNLDLHIEVVYGFDFEELTRKWRAYVLDHLDDYAAEGQRKK